MITVSQTMYRHIARLLKEAAGGLDFFNGTVEYDGDDFYSELVCTLIIYRDEHGCIVSASPVWWEYHIYVDKGEEPNDFDWKEFTQYL